MKPLYVKKNGTVNKVSGVAMPNTFPADRVGYDNTTSELEATNTQDAIDEVVDIVANKVDKVSSATNGNLAGLDASGNLTDAGWVSDKTTSNASGNPVSISGLKSNQLAINPIITLEPIQAGSGDPSPSNVRAISGYDKIEVLSCGKNVWSGGNVSGSIAIIENMPIKAISQGDYVISIDDTLSTRTAYVSFSFYDITNNIVGTATILGSSTYATFSLTGRAVSVTIYTPGTVDLKNIQIEEGTSATTYEPYHKTTDLSESLGQTVYHFIDDVRSGKIDVDSADYTFTGNETWMAWGTGAYYSQCLTKNAPSIQGTINVFTCEFAEPKTVTNIYSGASGIAVASGNIYISGDIYSSISSLTGKKLVYEVATHSTINLTPHEISLLKDYAYVSTNGTNIQFSYKNGEMASLADVAQVGETLNALGTKLNYHDYTVKGDGTTTWGDLLSSLRPIYESLSEDEKTFSKLIFRPESINGNECLSYCGAYWYSRMGLNGTTKTLWIDHASLGPGSSLTYYYQKNGDTFIDKTSGTTTYSLSLRVFVEVGNNS